MSTYARARAAVLSAFSASFTDEYLQQADGKVSRAARKADVDLTTFRRAVDSGKDATALDEVPLGVLLRLSGKLTQNILARAGSSEEAPTDDGRRNHGDKKKGPQ